VEGVDSRRSLVLGIQSLCTTADLCTVKDELCCLSRMHGAMARIILLCITLNVPNGK
jgi:hypothetical protein